MFELIRKNNTKTIKQNIKDNVEYLTFTKFDEIDFVKHAFSTRVGGASKGVYSTMNFSYTRGDDKERVDENYRRMSKILTGDTDINKFVTTYQTHTKNVRIITKDDMGKGVTKEREYVDVDGLITNEKGIVLTTFHADCPPVYFVDVRNKVIGLAHSGWKGTKNKISANMIKEMEKVYGSNPSDIICAIGPSICASCYEVSSDVAKEFMDEFKCDAAPYKEYDERIDYNNRPIVYAKENGKFQLDLWTCIYKTLIELAIPKENIAVTDVCTKCNSDYLFSHRVTGDKRGNLAAFLCLTKD